MPHTKEEHVTYTKNELNDHPYYKEIFKILGEEPIESYLDIGANVGEFHNQVVEKIPSIKKTYLIEPDPENFIFLKNHITYSVEVETFNMAISYTIKRGTLTTSRNVGGYMLVGSTEGGGVKIKTLESLKIPVVDFVKIDVEGMEYEILEKSSYLRQVEWLDVEFHQTPEQEQNSFVVNFIRDNFETHDIFFFEEGTHGRCLLRKK